MATGERPHKRVPLGDISGNSRDTKKRAAEPLGSWLEKRQKREDWSFYAEWQALMVDTAAGSGDTVAESAVGEHVGKEVENRSKARGRRARSLEEALEETGDDLTSFMEERRKGRVPTGGRH